MTPAPISVERALREVAEVERTLWDMARHDKAPVTVLAQTLRNARNDLSPLPALLQQLAEREAEVERLERDRDALGAKLVEECDLRIAVEASWHHELARATAAERAREGAKRDLRAIYEAVPGLPIYATEEDADRATDAFTAICHLCNEYIASDAASGGSNG